MSSPSLFSICLMLLLIQQVVSLDYGAALTKSILYYEAQRSGKLPPNQRIQWRGDSGLGDGSDNRIDLVGGYYDAGDNVKFGFPMAFTITMLSWSVIEFEAQLKAKNELSNALDAIKWGTDYLIKAHPQPNVLYGQVGDGDSDHDCWQRPEDMTTPRTSYKIDQQHPGSDLAGETAAAFAAAAIAFKESNPSYSSQLLVHAKQLFDFAKSHQGKYSDSISAVRKFYGSSGFQDELLWAAIWLHRASLDQSYLEYLQSQETGGTRTMFCWDDKFTGVQILISKLILEGKLDKGNKKWAEYGGHAQEFICNCIGKGSANANRTSGGLLWWDPWNDLQYAATASFVITSYSDYLTSLGSDLPCPLGPVSAVDLINFARSQVDYILGINPKNTSYMVGFGSNFPQQVHHRGASIVSMKKDKTPVTCRGGYENWFSKNAPNPNVLDGAIVGGPDYNDNYRDSRANYQQAEPTSVNAAPLVGVLARLAA